MQVTRRGALRALGVGTIGLAAGTYVTAAWSDTRMVRRVLERHLGPLNIAESDLDDFTAAYLESRPWNLPFGKLKAIVQVVASDPSLSDQVRRFLPSNKADLLERFERSLLSQFFTLTDVGWRADEDDLVHFVGPSACLNPFANFDL